MEIPLRTAYGQAGRCGMQPKPSSLRAQAHQSDAARGRQAIRQRQRRAAETEEETGNCQPWCSMQEGVI
ncbi:hypothetical protein TNCV_4514961 [Trichonephila clavipes]|nr:hypothetical protein TNCV_4514961 [Trichonephila clavipes]